MIVRKPYTVGSLFSLRLKKKILLPQTLEWINEQESPQNEILKILNQYSSGKLSNPSDVEKMLFKNTLEVLTKYRDVTISNNIISEYIDEHLPMLNGMTNQINEIKEIAQPKVTKQKQTINKHTDVVESNAHIKNDNKNSESESKCENHTIEEKVVIAENTEVVDEPKTTEDKVTKENDTKSNVGVQGLPNLNNKKRKFSAIYSEKSNIMKDL